MKLLKLVTLFTALSSFSFSGAASDKYLDNISEADKHLVVEQVRLLRQELCQCDDKFNDVNIDKILKAWKPLVVSNEKIFEKLIINLEKMAHINKVFKRKTDPNFLGYAMSMLRLFSQVSAEAGEPLNNKDIKTTLSILKGEYDLNVPEVVLNILSGVEQLSVKNDGKKNKLKLLTLNSDPIVIDLTNEDLLGDQEGNKNKFFRLTIENNSEITFSNDGAKYGPCTVNDENYDNCGVDRMSVSFFTERSHRTGKVNKLTLENAQEAVDFIIRRDYEKTKLDPLYIKYSGFKVNGEFDVLGGVKTEQDFKESVILPGTKNINAFYLKAKVKAMSGLVHDFVAITL